MSTRLRRLRMAGALAMLLAMPGLVQADDTAAANRLFVAAVNAWGEAQALSPAGEAEARQRAALLEAVVGNLRQIVDSHSGADLAVRLVIGEKIGPLSLPVAEAALQDALCGIAPDSACFFRDALRVIASIEHTRPRDSARVELVTALSGAGDFDGALSVLGAITDSGERVTGWTRLVERATDRDLVNRARTAISAAEPGISRRIGLLRVLEAQVRSGLFEDANDTLAMFDEPGDMQTPLASLSRGLHAAGLQREAARKAAAVENNTLRARLLAEIGDRKGALDTARGLEDVGRRAHALLQVAIALEDPGILAEALDLARQPDVPADWRLIGNIAAAMRNDALLREAVGAVFEGDDPEGVFSPLRALIRLQIEAGFLDDAFAGIRRLTSEAARDQLLIELAEAADSVDFFETALAIVRSGTPRSDREFALRRIGVLHVRHGRLAQAREIASALQFPTYAPDVIERHIAVWQARQGLPVEAAATARAIKTPLQQALALVGIGSALAGNP